MLNKSIFETGSGGSIIIKENDIQNDKGIFTPIYLKLFSSISPYWGNDIFEIEINSETQKALTENSINAEGLENIKRAVESDLSKLDFADFTVSLTPVNNDRIEIKIEANDNGQFIAIWNSTNNQIIESKII